jgi:hypothetical protein
MIPFDPGRMVEALHSNGVEFVLVGGLAAVAHGSSLATADLDIAPERSRANFDRLAAALRQLNAKLRVGADEGVEFPIDGSFLSAQPHMLNLTTDAGDLDLTITPAAFPNGYDDLIGAAVEMDLGEGRLVRIAALRDIIASKEAADRDKDRLALPYLRALADELGV